ncbi:unnamed protein product [Symbiodinium sp. CCMP2592]|nr:unnamed protein product [Symbiodinium sp. CCMP2592]
MAAPFRYLLLFTGFSACAQFDSGALAAFVDFLHKTLGFSTEDIGYINAMEYVLLPIASPLIPCLLKCLKVKIVLLICLVGNMLGVFGLVMGPKMHESGDSAFTLFVLSRAISGICHAGIAVYGSVWVDLHAPKDQAASWLGAMQASSLVGLVIGYTVAGYSEDWVTVFCVNLAWFGATFVCLACAASEFIGNATSPGGLGHGSSGSRVRLSFVSVPSGSFVDQADWADAREVELTEEPEVSLMSRQRPPASASQQNVQNLPVYALMAFCVSSLFFVSGGLQFWATPYMEQIRLKELREVGLGSEGAACAQVHSLVVTLVAVITLTAPTFGVFLGGGAVDSIGGYKGAAGRSTLKLLAAGALLAMVFGVTACFSTNFWLAVSTFWVFNMLGASLLPGAFGLMLASVRSEKTSAASAIAQIPINLLGMAGGAYIPGWLTGCKEDTSHQGGTGPSCDADCDYALGLRSLLLGPVFGFLCLILSLLLYRSPSESQETDTQELTLQASRRRLVLLQTYSSWLPHINLDLMTYLVQACSQLSPHTPFHIESPLMTCGGARLAALAGTSAGWITLRPVGPAGVAGYLNLDRREKRGASQVASCSTWTKNLLFLPPSGFWADDDWYDLQMARRLPLCQDCLREFVYALPPLSGKRVVDLGAGTGRSAAAVAAAYPRAHFTLIDPDEGRLRTALIKLRRAAEASAVSSSEVPEAHLVVSAVSCGEPLPGLPEGSVSGYDCVLALQAVRHIVAPAAHYAEKHGLATAAGAEQIRSGYTKVFEGIYSSLVPGGHVFLGDRVAHGHPGVYEHCRLLEDAGFLEIDIAWRQDDWFVIGARRPPI